MRDASICGLGQTASSAVESALARLGTRRTAPMTPAPIWFEGPPPPSRPPMAPERPALPPVEIVIDGEPARAPAGATILEACRARGHRHPHAVLPRDPDAGERLPRVRGRGDRLPRAGPGLLAPRGAGDDDPHRIRARAPVAPDGPRAAGLLRRSLDGARRRSPDDPLRRPPRALRPARGGRGPGRARRARARPPRTRPTARRPRPSPSR